MRLTSVEVAPIVPWTAVEFLDGPAVEIQFYTTKDFNVQGKHWRVVSGAIRIADLPNTTEYSFTVTTNNGQTAYGIAEPPDRFVLGWADKTPVLPTPNAWLEAIRIDLATEFAAYMETR